MPLKIVIHNRVVNFDVLSCYYVFGQDFADYLMKIKRSLTGGCQLLGFHFASVKSERIKAVQQELKKNSDFFAKCRFFVDDKILIYSQTGNDYNLVTTTLNLDVVQKHDKLKYVDASTVIYPLHMTLKHRVLLSVPQNSEPFSEQVMLQARCHLQKYPRISLVFTVHLSKTSS